MKKTLITLALVVASINTYSQWNRINSFPAISVSDLFVSGSIIYASTNNNGVYKSTDAGATWQQFNNGLNNAQAIQCKQVLLTGNVLYTATIDGIYKSTDFASSWVKKSNGIVVGGGAIYTFAESIFELNGVLFTGTYTGIYRSTNNGENWITTNIMGSAISAKNFTLHNGILFAARENINNPIGYKSTDNGLTWGNLSGLSFFSTITFFSEPGKLFAGTIHGAWLSTNSGTNWVERSAGLNADPYNSSFIRVNNVFITSLKLGGSGIFKSTNDGVLWVNFGDGLPFLLSIEELIISGSKMLAATSSGIYQRNSSEVTGIIQISSEVPGKFSLEQNYPNPFNPETKFRFHIPEKGNVKLTVFDLLGRNVSALVNQNLEPGTYEAGFNASGLNSGVYFYRLESNGYTETKKMILVK